MVWPLYLVKKYRLKKQGMDFIKPHVKYGFEWLKQ